MTEQQQYIQERSLLEQLAKLGDRFRATPVVDDDFCSLRDSFDNKLKEVLEYIKDNKPLEISKTFITIDGCMGQQQSAVCLVTRKKEN